MFYPVDSLKRGGRFYLCWVADSWPMRFAAITHRQLWSHDIRQLCDDLLEVMTNESGRPANRFSLRLSSQLMRGLVRLYERKATVLLGDLCMIHATVFKSTNRKGVAREAHERPPRRLPQLPPPAAAVVPEEPENEKQLEEMIQNSGNVVINIQDITLKEAAIPDFQLPPNDNFGEENPEQPLQNLLADRTIELMMQETSGAQTSGLDLPVPVTDKSHDKSRPVHDAPQMEAVSDVDITLVRKSAAEDQLPAFGKDVPEIPELPIPDLPVPTEPVPPPLVQVTEQQEQEVIPEEQPPPTEVPAPVVADKRRRKSGAGDMELEELEDQPVSKKRRMRAKLILDKKIRLASGFLRARIENPYVEMRFEDPEDAVIDLRTPADILLRRPGHDGTRILARMTPVLSLKFHININLLADRQPEPTEPEVEQPRQRRPRSSIPALEKIPETEEQQIETPAPQRPEMDVTRRANEGPEEAVNIPDLNLTAGLDVTAGVVDVSKDPLDVMGEVLHVEPRAPTEDIADLPTQKLETLSQLAAKRPSQSESPTKRHKPEGHLSFSDSQRASSAPNKENIPPNIISPPLPPLEQSQADATRMLKEAGLCEVHATEAIQPVEQPVTRKDRSEGSETPLGSLDRTKVSLGDSVKTTDSQRFIRRQWGIEGTMLKIMKSLRFSIGPVTVSALLERGPLLPGHKRIIAARCFGSILRLIQHGFIRVVKDPETLEIRDITLGPRFDSL